MCIHDGQWPVAVFIVIPFSVGFSYWFTLVAADEAAVTMSIILQDSGIEIQLSGYLS